MDLLHWPWKPDADYTRLVSALARQGSASRVPFLELFADPEVIATALEEPVPPLTRWGEREMREILLDQKIRFWHTLGYDAIWQGPVLDLPGIISLASDDTASLKHEMRIWVNETTGIIHNWQSFEAYPWPSAQDADYWPMEFMAARLPEGMGMLVEISGVYEPISFLMGYETLSLALYEQPDLVEAIISKVREIFLPVIESVAQMDRVIGIWVGDDLGFKTGTLISPRHLRQYIFPVLKEMAALTHAHGLPFLLHSCGDLNGIMEDLIEDVGIDAKHSFEDIIDPVESFSARYGDRIAVIGGVDVDLLSRGSEEQVRARTRQILETCAPSRGYILGSGNSITNYIPLENFLAMIDEGWKFNL